MTEYDYYLVTRDWLCMWAWIGWSTGHAPYSTILAGEAVGQMN